MAGAPPSKHSMNQRQMKLSDDRVRMFYRGATRFESTSPTAAETMVRVLTDEEDLCRLVASGLFGQGYQAELQLAIHTVGSLLNRIRALEEAVQ